MDIKRAYRFRFYPTPEQAVRLTLAKMAAQLAIRWSRRIASGAKVSTVTMSKDTAGRYHISLLCDDMVCAKLKSIDTVGIDLGLTDCVVLSTGEKIAAPNAFRKNEAINTRLARLQRRLARKRSSSANRGKARRKVARRHARTADSRRGFLHKLSTRLIDENPMIAIESLARQPHAEESKAREIDQRCRLVGIRTATDVQGQWYGRTLIGIDRRYPSSKQALCRLPACRRRCTHVTVRDAD